jgi:hypothetical protein
MNLHPWRARRAKLKSSISRKPRPPRNFGFVIFSHEIQHVFLFPSLDPHQKLLIREFICLHNPLGSLKQDMEKVGIACTTDFISTSLPPADKHCSIHPWILFQMRSFKYLKAPLADLPTSEGIPRYFSLRDSF